MIFVFTKRTSLLQVAIVLALRLKLVAGPVICHGVKPYRGLNSADLQVLERPTMVMRPDLMTVGDLLPETEIKIKSWPPPTKPGQHQSLRNPKPGADGGQRRITVWPIQELRFHDARVKHPRAFP